MKNRIFSSSSKFQLFSLFCHFLYLFSNNSFILQKFKTMYKPRNVQKCNSKSISINTVATLPPPKLYPRRSIHKSNSRKKKNSLIYSLRWMKILSECLYINFHLSFWSPSSSWFSCFLICFFLFFQKRWDFASVC